DYRHQAREANVHPLTAPRGESLKDSRPALKLSEIETKSLLLVETLLDSNVQLRIIRDSNKPHAKWRSGLLGVRTREGKESTQEQYGHAGAGDASSATI